VAQVRALLKAGEVTVTFDPKTENCTLLTRQQFRREVEAATHAESKADDDASIYEDYCQDQGGVE
jgi:hypothetical protein